MSVFKKKSLLENVVVLLLVGLFAGLAGGGAVAFITGRTPSSTSAAK